MGNVLNEPWQLKLFSKTLKKKQKLKLLMKLLGPPHSRDRVLLLTNGDNSGAMNYYFRQLGGQWTWAEFEESSIPEMQSFLNEKVFHVNTDHLQFSDAMFDAVIVIDVHEHLVDSSKLNRELFRIVKPAARVIVTVPNGDSRKLAVRIKNALGMTKELYGHVRDGYTIEELRELLSAAGFSPNLDGSYSNFFTEMVELAINFAYVKILNRRKGAERSESHAPIAPSSAEQVKQAEKTLKLYALIYPFCRLLSSLDSLLNPISTGYAVAVTFDKPA